MTLQTPHPLLAALGAQGTQLVLLGRRSLEDVHVASGSLPDGKPTTACGLVITPSDTVPSQRSQRSRKEPYRVGCRRCARHLDRIQAQIQDSPARQELVREDGQTEEIGA